MIRTETMDSPIFHIGHHKTATSWLQDYYFSMHPDINVISDYREPWKDPFLKYLIASSERKFSVRRCQEVFEKQLSTVHQPETKTVVSAERLSGAPFSGGYDSFILAERIHACFPNARIIMAIRNQSTMIRSLYKQQIREGYIGLFSDFVYTAHSWSGTVFSLDMLEYDLLINKYLDLFSTSNLLVLVYEDFIRDPAVFLNNISDFLGISTFESPDTGRKINKGRNDSKTKRKRLLNHFRKSDMNPFPLISLSEGSRRKLYRALSPLYALSKKELIAAADLEYIKNYYREPNKRLRSLLQRELPDYP